MLIIMLIIVLVTLTISYGFIFSSNSISRNNIYYNKYQKCNRMKSSLSLSIMEDIDDKINSAIESYPNRNGFKVTSADIASSAGVDLNVASSALISRAYDTGALMDVISSGDIVYTFPQDYKNKLLSKSIKYKLQTIKKVIVPFLSRVFVVSFGLVFLSTTMLVLSTLLMLASQTSDDNNKNSSRRYSSSATVEIPVRLIFDSIYDFLYYQQRYSSIDSIDEDFQLRRRRLSFVESFYSFFFGDGNSNKFLDQVQFASIATLIRNNNGAVIAEQLNPFLLEPPDLKTYLSRREDVYNGVNEKHVLPVLIAYNGYPTVTETGDLVYQFKELMNTATNETSMNRLASNKLVENEQVFSLCSPPQLVVATTLGLFNFIGSLLIGRRLKEAQYLGVARSAYPFLLTYSFLYLAIPLVRFLVTSSRNRERMNRNNIREEWRLWLTSEKGREILATKLASRLNMRVVPKNDADKIIYTTNTKQDNDDDDDNNNNP